ncbi:cyclic pyranopterin monophosphate synthase MoaC [Qipengyuania qiaonensis]|uniref:Cyclic pyranopterin monophosphate synthase n=1 Tax=Qipengyuania qiaonensis TaxID=2867240 RepID=A0ABS7J4K7_9SPHN|nr:cyclic pyranopterin monophosphate synthase MoaC [Qipengyuania qiaonensis]MBX7480945.1 cyclic pyranopterin monophosphate synthase MoaC [Qipengyuania qiaonensis]
MSDLSHIDEHGRARMVDVGDKSITARRATAAGTLTCNPTTLELLKANKVPKGNVIGTAELAGVMAAKRTADLIPLCHPLPLSQIDVSIEADAGLPGFAVAAKVRSEGRTGVEMEALTAVSVACLTLFDMLKAIDKEMTIGDIRVTAKEGGRSGDWKRG